MPSDQSLAVDRDQLRIYVVCHPGYFEGPLIAQPVVAHFEGVSERIGKQPITARVLSVSADPVDPTGPPAPVDTEAADVSVVVILAEPQLMAAFDGPWAGFRDALLAAMPAEDEEPTPGFLLPLVIALEPSALDPFRKAAAAGSPVYDAKQAERAYDWPHAAEAEHGVAIVSRIRERCQASNYGLDAYFDETHTVPGFGWKRQFRRAIAGSSFLAVGTDACASRPVCQWELLQAKRSRRPIMSINAVSEREAAIFSYGGNVPSSRVAGFSDAEIDGLLLDLVTEAVRSELWLRDARRVADRRALENVTLLPRPIELVDLAFHVMDGSEADASRSGHATLVYPDPPLSDDVMALIEALKPDDLDIMPLSRLEGAL